MYNIQNFTVQYTLYTQYNICYAYLHVLYPIIAITNLIDTTLYNTHFTGYSYQYNPAHPVPSTLQWYKTSHNKKQLQVKTYGSPTLCTKNICI